MVGFWFSLVENYWMVVKNITQSPAKGELKRPTANSAHIVKNIKNITIPTKIFLFSSILLFSVEIMINETNKINSPNIKKSRNVQCIRII